ncbi:hypothetical protein T484DRAFT_1873549, partial [Baffinella frigidus]
PAGDFRVFVGDLGKHVTEDVYQNWPAGDFRVFVGDLGKHVTEGLPAGDFRVFVGDLGKHVTDRQLTELLRGFRGFNMARVVADPRSKLTKGCCSPPPRLLEAV